MKAWLFAQQSLRPLGLSSQTINALWFRGICTREDLLKLSEQDAKSIVGIGPKALESLRPFLNSNRRRDQKLTILPI